MAESKVATQSKEKRIKNYNEVSLGYSKKLTASEAKRCPQCSNPVCMEGCPLGIDIPGFIRLLREGNTAGAYEIIRKNNPLPSICGRICSAPCEAACILQDENQPINIRALERYAADYGRPRLSRADDVSRRGKKIAIVGSGPSGLTAAAGLAARGYQVTIFESFDRPGGVLRYGIPQFRIPHKVLDAEIEEIRALGVDIQTNVFIGHTKTLQDVFAEDFSAVLLATGAGIPKFLDIPGNHLGGVYYGEEFLMRINQRKTGFFSPAKPPPFFLGNSIAVIGSGNTALDCARSAVRLGKEVRLLFRRTEEDMRVKATERDYAKEEGVILEPLVRPIEIKADNNNYVGGLKCMRMDFGDPDKKGAWKLIPVPGSEFVLDVDTVVIAVGHKPNPPIQSESFHQLQCDDEGSPIVNGQGMTNIPKVFAVGNVVSNAGPAVQAMASAKEMVQMMDDFLQK